MKKLVVVALLLALAGCSKKPLHKGKSADEWAQALRDSDVQARREAAAALAELGPHARGAVLILADALRDTDDQVRVKASLALWSLGPEGSSAAFSLAGALADRNAEV